MAPWPYSTNQWRMLRAAKLRADKHCLHCLTFHGVRVPAMAVDHISRLLPAVLPFPPLSGLRSLCLSCHNSKTARADMARRKASARPVRGFDAQGNPVSRLVLDMVTADA